MVLSYFISSLSLSHGNGNTNKRNLIVWNVSDYIYQYYQCDVSIHHNGQVYYTENKHTRMSLVLDSIPPGYEEGYKK